MRRGLKLCLVTLALMAAWALAPPPAFAGIGTTKHDFTTTGPNASFKGATTLCETCHYPHNSGSTQLIWNHTLSAKNLTFGAGAATVVGTTLPSSIETAPGTSKYCLSCHDGTVNVGDLIKGTDWVQVGVTGEKITGAAVTGTAGNISGNHPVEVPYPDSAGATYNSITTKADPAGYNASPTKVRLQGTTAGAKGIMCASCHDPHDATIAKFLRVAYSSLCTSCHIK